jgi:hypothetical protein
MAFSNAAMEAGLSIRELSGRVETQYAAEPERPGEFRVNIATSGFKVGGAALGSGHAVVESGPAPGSVVVREVIGDCYGGRYYAHAEVDPARAGAGRSFAAELKVAGARFHPLLEDISPETGAPAASHAEDAAGDFSRGILDANVSLTGVANEPALRRGRGSFRVAGGRVLNIPFMTRMVEVSNLTLPTNARLDYATGNFFIDGNLVTFDGLDIHSKTIALEGYGTMTWPEKILDLRFNSRAQRSIPLLGDFFRHVRDELLTTRITGKLGEQEVRLQQFPGTRRMLGRAVGSGESAGAHRLSGIERRGREEGIRPAPAGIRPSGPEEMSIATPDGPARDQPPP